MDIKATPTEIEIAAIVGEMVHDGFMDLDTDDIVLLEQHTHAGYKHIADKFEAWALELLLRRKRERMADYARIAAEIDDEWYTTTTEDVDVSLPE